MVKNMISRMKKLVVFTLVAIMAISMFPTTADAASTHTSVYRKANSLKKKMNNLADYYGYYVESSLTSNTSTEVVWSLKYTNTENKYFKMDQITTKKNGRITTVYQKGGENFTYKGIAKSLKNYKTQNGYTWQEKSSVLADPIIEEAEKDGWTLSNFSYPASKTGGSTKFTATNKAGKVYKIAVSRVPVKKTKSVKTVYKYNGQTTTKEMIIKGLKKYA